MRSLRSQPARRRKRVVRVFRRAVAKCRAASPRPAPDHASLDPGETTTDPAVCPDIVSFLFPHDPRFAQGVDILAQDWMLLPYLGRGIPPVAGAGGWLDRPRRWNLPDRRRAGSTPPCRHRSPSPAG